MKKPLLVALLFLFTLGVALWALGVFAKLSPTPEAPGVAPEAPPTGPTSLTPSGEPKDEPEPDFPPLPADVRVLLLGDVPRTFTSWLFQLWENQPRILWQAWYAGTVPEGVATHHPSVPALGGAPTPADFEAAAVLVIGGVDPASLPADTWRRVADRVRAGTLGLLVLPESRFCKALAEEPSLRGVLPITGVKPVAPVEPGSPRIHGVYDPAQTFRATEAGLAHTVTRFTDYPKWNRRIWELTAIGPARWATKFCAPVEGVAPGASTLVELDAAAGRVPAVVVTDGAPQRVIWLGGFHDLAWDSREGFEAYRNVRSIQRMQGLMHRWVAWLARAL